MNTVSGATVVTTSGGVRASRDGGEWPGKVTYRGGGLPYVS